MKVYDTTQAPITAVTAGQQILVSADGIDTAGSTVQFIQGTSTWEVPADVVFTNTTVGIAARVTVPAIVAGGAAVQIAINQSGGGYSAPIVLIAQ